MRSNPASGSASTKGAFLQVVRVLVDSADVVITQDVFLRIGPKRTTTDVHIFVNGVNVWSAFVTDYRVKRTKAYLVAGEIDDFVVERGQNNDLRIGYYLTQCHHPALLLTREGLTM